MYISTRKTRRFILTNKKNKAVVEEELSLYFRFTEAYLIAKIRQIGKTCYDEAAVVGGQIKWLAK